MAVVAGMEANWLAEKIATEELKKAERRGISINELTAQVLGGQATHPTDLTNDRNHSTESRPARGQRQSFNAAIHWQSNATRESDLSDSDEEEGGIVMISNGGRKFLSPIAECRRKSDSVLLHFPHVELVFLIFAFEGAVAAQISAIRHAECAWVVFMAIAALVLYPVLMIVMVWRTVMVRVKTEALIIFTPKDTQADSADDSLSPSTRSLSSKFQEGWKNDISLFTWADKGQWETNPTADGDTAQEANRFRIGFAPLFVDLTQSGSWFVVFFLGEWTAFACIGVLVDNSTAQLSLFCAVHTVSFVLLVVLKPFANWIINIFAAGVVATDAISMALLAVAALRFEGTQNAANINTAVMILQLVAISSLVLPVYIDTMTTIVGGIRRKIQDAGAEGRSKRSEVTDEERDTKRFIRRYTRRVWLRTWCTMVRYNVVACGQETAEGVRQPRIVPSTRSRRTGPYPPIDGEDDVGEEIMPRRPGVNVLGTANTPVVVGATLPGTREGLAAASPNDGALDESKAASPDVDERSS